MNDQEIIRKAVELADGWGFTDDGYYMVDVPEYGALVPMKGMFLDALAAQLVRQVDALGNVASVRIWRDGSEVFYGVESKAFSTTQRGGAGTPDRTMNTLRAIVESKVLETA